MGDVDPSDGTDDGRLEILGEATAAIEPGKGAFDHPTARQNLEAFGGVASLDDLNRPLAHFGQGAGQFLSGVAAVGEQVAQPWIEATNGRDDTDGSVTILDVGGMDRQTDHVALRVGDDVPLTAFDLLPGVIAARPAALCRLRGLAVDHARRWTGVPPLALSLGNHQSMVDPYPRSVLRPPVEIALDRRIGRKLPRQLPPLATRRCQVQDRLDDAPQRRFARAANPVRFWHQRFDQRPLRIRHVACVTHSLPPILSASDLSPGHRELSRLCGNSD